MKLTLAAATIALTTLAVNAQPASACRQQLWSDAHAIAADLQAIRAQIVSEDYQATIEQYADALSTEATDGPALVRYMVALRDTSPDDLTAPLQQLKLSNAIFVMSIGSGQSALALGNLPSAFASVDTTQLTLDVQTLLADAQSCRQ